MRALLVLFMSLFIFSTPVFAGVTRVVLDYDFGTLSSRSGLTVLSNGLVMHRETSNGVTVYLEDSQLTPNEQIDLFLLIFEAAETPELRQDRLPKSLDGFFGRATAHGSDGVSFDIYALTQADSPDKAMICRNNFSAAKIRALIQSRVRDRMPLPQGPCP